MQVRLWVKSRTRADLKLAIEHPSKQINFINHLIALLCCALVPLQIGHMQCRLLFALILNGVRFLQTTFQMIDILACNNALCNAH